MMSDLQKEALAVLAEVCELSPDIRLGQLFSHLGFLGEAHLDRSLGYIDDDELLSILYKHRAELQARLVEDVPRQMLKHASAGLLPSHGSEIAEESPKAEN